MTTPPPAKPAGEPQSIAAECERLADEIERNGTNATMRQISQWAADLLQAALALRAASPEKTAGESTGDPDMPNLSLCSFSYLADELRRRGATVTPAPHGGDFTNE